MPCHAMPCSSNDGGGVTDMCPAVRIYIALLYMFLVCVGGEKPETQAILSYPLILY